MRQTLAFGALDQGLDAWEKSRLIGHRVVDRLYIRAACESFGMDATFVDRILDRAYAHADIGDEPCAETWEKPVLSRPVPWPCYIPGYYRRVGDGWWQVLGYNLQMLGLLEAYPETHPEKVEKL